MNKYIDTLKKFFAAAHRLAMTEVAPSGTFDKSKIFYDPISRDTSIASGSVNPSSRYYDIRDDHKACNLFRD